MAEGDSSTAWVDEGQARRVKNRYRSAGQRVKELLNGDKGQLSRETGTRTSQRIQSAMWLGRHRRASVWLLGWRKKAVHLPRVSSKINGCLARPYRYADGVRQHGRYFRDGVCFSARS